MEAAREARESLEEAERDAAALASGKITAAKDMTANMHTFKYDKKMTSCEGCSKKFTTFLRRHHCRGCRGAYCHYCSKKKIEVPDWPGKQRVCDECFDQYSVRCIIPPSPKSTRQPLNSRLRCV